MTTDAFNEACDRIARELDPTGYENRRWAKDEGAKLDQVATLIQQSFAKRDDLKVNPTPPSPVKDARGFVLMLGSDEVVRLTAKLSGPRINIWAVEIEGAAATVPQGGNVPGSVALDNITPEAVSDAVAAALKRIMT